MGERRLKPFNPKPRPCKGCNKPFVPTKPLQSVCGPRCAVKKVKQDKAEERAKVKTRKEAIKTPGERKAEAQAALNKWVVHCRDKDLPCISCGRHHQGQYHGGHYRSRGSAAHLALDPRNVHKQCAPCNTYLSGNLIEYRKRLIERKGLEFVEALETDDEPRHHSPQDLDAIKTEYRQKLKTGSIN